MLPLDCQAGALPLLAMTKSEETGLPRPAGLAMTALGEYFRKSGRTTTPFLQGVGERGFV